MPGPGFDARDVGAPLSPAEHRRLLAEIEAEVEARRERGDIPEELEEELDALFARFSPLCAGGDDTTAVLERVDDAAYPEGRAPIDSEKPAGAYVKRAVRSLIAWHQEALVQELREFTSSATSALHLLDRRLRALEQLVVPPDPALVGALGAAAAVDPARFLDVAATAIASSPRGGRVLHAHCGDGAFAAALASATGRDVYGVDPDTSTIASSDELDLDLRPEDALAHLRALSVGVLAGAVLSGATDVLPPGAKVSMLSAAASRLRPGGVLVVIGAEPGAWAAAGSELAADLAPGRPFHPATWCRLAEQEGLTGAEVGAGAPGAPEAYAVVARRPA